MFLPWQHIAGGFPSISRKGKKQLEPTSIQVLRGHPSLPILSHPIQQLANPGHHGLNHIQHLWLWFAIPLHTFHATNLLFMTHTHTPPSPLPSHTLLRLPGFEANLFAIVCALQCSVKVKHYQREYGIEDNWKSPIKLPVWLQWFQLQQLMVTFPFVSQQQ